MIHHIIEKQSFTFPPESIKISKNSITIPLDVYNSVIDAIALHSNTDALKVFNSYSGSLIIDENGHYLIDIIHQFIDNSETIYNINFSLTIISTNKNIQIIFNGEYTKYPSIDLDIGSI